PPGRCCLHSFPTRRSSDLVDMHVLDAAGKTIRFSVDDQGEKPVDLYTIRPEGSGQPYAVPIARDTGAPSKPDHFKIRIVNLCKTDRKSTRLNSSHVKISYA